MSVLYPYRVKRIILSHPDNLGERLPMLVHRDSGVPLYLPNLWALTDRRGNGLASNTIDQQLRHIGRFEHWVTQQGLSLSRPLEFLERCTPAKIDSSLRPYVGRDFSRTTITNIAVGAQHIRSRVLTICAYVEWVLDDAIRDLSIQHEAEKIVAFTKFKDGILRNLKSISPTQVGADSEEGLNEKQLQRLLDIIEPDHPCNPWTEHTNAKGRAVRCRNELIVSLMAAFGIRRGDLLKLYTTDVLVHGSEPVLSVKRRPDDPADPRAWEPNAKTQERKLPLDARLVRMLNNYIENHRAVNKRAKKTPYLFVGTGEGQPLSLKSINNIFESLRSEFPGIHPHTMRHTHNSAMMRIVSLEGLNEAQGIEISKYINGWLTDNQATYAKAELRAQAQKLSKKHQSGIFNHLRCQ